MDVIGGLAIGALIVWVSLFIGFVLGATDDFEEEEDTNEYERERFT